MSESRSGVVGVCDTCGAAFRVKSAEKSYACKKCDGTVRAPREDDGEDAGERATPSPAASEREPSNPYAAPAKPDRRRAARPKPEPTAAQTKRRDRARASKNVTRGVTFIENVLLFGIVFAAMRALLYLRLVQVFWLSGITFANGTPIYVELAVELIVEIGLIALLVLARKNVRSHPTGLILALAIVQTLGFLINAVPMIPEFSVMLSAEYEWTSVDVVILAILGLSAVWTALFWVAYRLVKGNKERYEALKEE